LLWLLLWIKGLEGSFATFDCAESLEGAANVPDSARMVEISYFQ
jgi:hypothetical protein